MVIALSTVLKQHDQQIESKQGFVISMLYRKLILIIPK